MRLRRWWGIALSCILCIHGSIFSLHHLHNDTNKTEMTWQVSIIPNCSPDNELWFCQVVKEILNEYNRIEWFALRVTISSHWRESATNVISRSPEHYCKSEKEAENNPSRSRCSTDCFFLHLLYSPMQINCTVFILLISPHLRSKN